MKKIPEESGTLSVFHQMTKLQSQGTDIINLCVGEPDIPPSSGILSAGINPIKSHLMHYTPSEGIPELRRAIAALLMSEGLEPDPDREILVTAGAKPALFMTFMSLAEHKDEVLIPIPCYPSYIPIVRYAGAKPVMIPGNQDRGYKADPAGIEPYLTPQSRFFILNSPVNPTGSVYTPEELKELLGYLTERNIMCVIDDVYRHFIYDKQLRDQLSGIFRDYYQSVILIRSFSKEFAMTGWRIGYAVASEMNMSRMKILQGHASGNAQTASQYAAIEALQHSEKYALPLNVFESRREDVKQALSKVKNLSLIDPAGAFYVFADIRKCCPGQSSDKLCYILMKEAGVAVTPGSAFGIDGFIRISYADGSRLKEGLERLVSGLDSV